MAQDGFFERLRRMHRLIAVYLLFSVVLFGALFAAFYVAGLGTPTEDWTPYSEPAAPDPATSTAPPPDPLAEGLDHPALQPGQTYRVSHATKLFAEPGGPALDAESLPARGYFTVEAPVDLQNDRWYRVTVNDGVHDYSRFVLARDLNFKRVTAVRTEAETDEERVQRTIAMLEAIGEERRRERLASMPPVEPEPRTPENWSEWWAMTAHRMGGATWASVVASGVAAAIGTVLSLLSIHMLVTLKRDHTWERPPTHDVDDEWAEATRDEDDPVDGPTNPTDPRW